jgi:hypothetical protein
MKLQIVKSPYDFLKLQLLSLAYTYNFATPFYVVSHDHATCKV